MQRVCGEPTALLTDKYQISMAYAYWKARTHLSHSSFDLYFRRAPFRAACAVFAGLSRCVRFLSAFRFTPPHVRYIASLLPHCEPQFLQWLRTVDCSRVRVYAQPEGSIVFANVPLLRVCGPLAVVQLLETTLLNLLNYASLVATNAFRFRIAAGPHAKLFEFGLRRAQGPDGAMSASRYTFQAAFDATSNVAAGFEFGIPVVGTMAHSFVQSFASLHHCCVPDGVITTASGHQLSFQSFKNRVLAIRDTVLPKYNTCDGELAAFICYAFVYPSSFLALVDTYNSIQSGVPNFMCVALVLHEHAFAPVGIRLDSGHLGNLSIQAHASFSEIAHQYIHRIGTHHSDALLKMVSNLRIVASDNITVAKLLALRQLNHKISAFGIGTHLVTCAEQPAFGGVFKLASIDHQPCMKLSNDPTKASIPGEKVAYRIYNQHGKAVCDVLALECEEAPSIQKDLILRDSHQPQRTVTIVPHRVRKLHHLVWDGQPCGEQLTVLDSMQRAKSQLITDAAEFEAAVLGVTCETKEYPVFITPLLCQMINDLRIST